MPSLPRLMNSSLLSLPGLSRLSVLNPICNFFCLHITVFSEASVYAIVVRWLLFCRNQSGPAKSFVGRELVTSMTFNEIKRILGAELLSFSLKH